MLKVEGVNAHYDGVQALWGVSFEVKEGEIVALVGSNGAGKTTVLRTISRLLPVSEGSIELADRDLARAGSHDVVAAGVAHVPEARQLFPMMTVLENLELGAYLPEPRSRIKESLARVYDLFPILHEREDQLAGTLSGGEQQMLAATAPASPRRAIAGTRTSGRVLYLPDDSAGEYRGRHRPTCRTAREPRSGSGHNCLCAGERKNRASRLRRGPCE